MATLGLCCFERIFSSCSKQGLFSNSGSKLLIEPHGILYCGTCALGTHASVVVEHRLSSSGLHPLGLKGLVAVEHSMWNLPRPGIKLMCPALAGRLLSTVPPGKFHTYNFWYNSLELFWQAEVSKFYEVKSIILFLCKLFSDSLHGSMDTEPKVVT